MKPGTNHGGEENDVRNHYNELTMKLAQRKGLKRQLTIVFRVFDDGMGFRYVFPEQKNLKHFVIMDEETEFCFKGDPEAWTLPMTLITTKVCGRKHH